MVKLSDWFKGSYVTDSNGGPLLVFRGEHSESGSLIQSRLGAISFSSIEIATTYANTPNSKTTGKVCPRVIPAYLRITNPIIHNVDDPFVDLSVLMDKLGIREATRIALKFSTHIEETGNWIDNFDGRFNSVEEAIKSDPRILRSLYFDAFRYLDDVYEVEKLKSAGFDGAIHLGNGVSAGENEYKVFSISQIRIDTDAMLDRKEIPQATRMRIW